MAPLGSLSRAGTASYPTHIRRLVEPAQGARQTLVLLSYTSFESALRYCARKLGIRVHAHLFRHTFAQGVVQTTGSLSIAQALLGHAHVGTTADLYTHTDHQALVAAVAAVKTAFAAASMPPNPATDRYAFAYDPLTLAELDQAVTP